MKKFSAITSIMIIFLVLVICFSLTAWGGETLFSKKYLQGTGKPQVFTDTFSVAEGYGNFKLSVINGENGKNRVSSALIYINGTLVVGPSNFNQNVGLITKSIGLKTGGNEINVEIRSQPGSFIVVTIEGEKQNQPPVANAGPDQTAVTTHTVQLNGNGSSDIDGDALTYTWLFIGRPSESTAVLSDPSIINPTFVADKSGNYTIQLVVNDGTVDSAPDTVVISTLNSAPVANAGVDQTVHLSAEVLLNGSGSSDVDGNLLTYSWSFVGKPAESSAAFSDSSIVNPTFVADKSGNYTIQLIVNDGTDNSAPDLVIISTENSPPVANAGPNQTSFVTQTVVLDGSKSFDADGNPLSFLWSFASRPSESSAELSDPSAVKPTFFVDMFGTYVVQLIVNDGQVNSSSNTVTISTLNTAPVAKAGPDQTVYVGDVIQLDGSASSDVDGNHLTWAWSFVSVPLGSTAHLSDQTIVNPTFNADKFGDYVVQLIVNDVQANSSPDTVTISTINSKPVANAGPDQTIHAGKQVFLDGSGSSDVDGDFLTYAWSFSSVPSGSAAALSGENTGNPSFLSDKIGDYVIQLIVNDSKINSNPDSVTISTINSRPVAEAGASQNVIQESLVQLNGSGSSDADGDMLYYFWAITGTPADSQAVLSDQFISNPSFIADLAGPYVAQLIVSDGFSNSDPDTTTITATAKMVTVPNVVGTTQSAAQAAITAASLSVGSITQANSDTVPTGSVISQNPAGGTSVPQANAVNLTISLGSPGPVLPPDPATVAPPLDTSIPTSIYTSTEFLYTGASPIQTGVAPGTIEAKRAAVLRGKVLNREGSPLSGVRIAIHNHPEFGQTLSRSDGMFDIAVNGGGLFNVNYDKSGYLSAQRVVNVPWQDYVVLQDIVLIQPDNRVTAVDLTANLAFQAAQGSPVTDADGTRRATLLFAQGTMANMVMPDGSTLPLTSLNVRATEYTVGTNGPAAMPAPLPHTSGYTYAVELSADEAISAGATDVRFDRPVNVYVENFLNFPVGGIVPAGYYDRNKAAWIPSDNGKVLKILSIVNGMAALDSTGDGLADNGVAIGVTDAERMQLASLYASGQSLWRVPTTHFTPWDYNWPYGPPPDAKPPQVAPPQRDTVDCGCTVTGSIIDCQKQTLGESVKIVGTPFDLHYVSSRVPGRKLALTIPLRDAKASIPQSLRRIELKVDVAGRSFSYKFSASELSAQFIWDGLDAYGRAVSGSTPITVRVGYVYGAVYYQPAQLRAFSMPSDTDISVASVREALEVIISQAWTGFIRTLDARGYGLGGWTLNVHHTYDPSGRTLYLGDGAQRSAASMSEIITTVVGTGVEGFSGDGGPATNAQINLVYGNAIGKDGSLYIAEFQYNNRVRKVGPDGIITTVAGSGAWGFSGDGGPATKAALRSPSGIAIGQDGSIYFADVGNERIRRVDPDGIITTVAGTGVPGYSGDGGPATEAALHGSYMVAIGKDGSLYMPDQFNQRIRRVGPDGIITTVAGTGVAGFSGDGGPATKAKLNWPYGITIGPDGSIYIGDISNSRIRRVGPDGIITTVAGTGVWGYSGDGGPATSAGLENFRSIAIGQDGSLYISDYYRVRMVGPDGIITTVAGTGVRGFSGDGGPANAAQMNSTDGIAISQDGSLYIVDMGNHRIRKVEPAMPGFTYADIIIPSESGDEIYVFDASGRHDRTLNAYTNSIIYRFYYDSAGRLSSVDDAYGNSTLIERSGSGAPTAITGPFGQQTQLTTNGDGYLASISDPSGQATSFTYTASGLMTGMTEPKGYLHAFSYGSDGSLIQDEDANDPTHGVQSLSRSAFTTGYSVVHSSAEGRQTTYRIERLSTGDERQTNTFPTGAITTTSIGANGTETTTFADGSSNISSKTPDPRFGMRSPLFKTTLKMPSSLALNSESKRTVNLSDPSDLLSVQTLSENITICPGCPAQRTYTRTYSAGDKKYTYSTAQGLIQEVTVNDQGAITRSDFVRGANSGISIDPITFNYNAQGLVTNTVFGDTRLTFDYDALGRMNATSNAAGETTSFVHDAANRLTGLSSPHGRVFEFNYDANNNLTQISMPSSTAHGLSYNSMNLLSGYTPPGIGQPSYSWGYNKERALSRMTLPEGRNIDLSYDAGGRIKQIQYAEADVLMTYNDVTERISRIIRTPSSGTAQQMDYTYDGALLKSVVYSGVANGTYAYTYDNNFFLTNIAFGSDSIALVMNKDGLVTRYGNFSFGREQTLGKLSIIEDSGTGTHTLRIDYTYDALGRLAGRVHQVKTGVDGGGNPIYKPIFSLQLSRDNTGRITRKNDGSIFDYAYDADGQLLMVKNDAGSILEQYAYDANANRISSGHITASYDEQDRILNQGGVTYQHNADGFMTQRGSETLVYSARGELLQATVGGNIITYAYDGYGRRIGRKIGSENWCQYFYADPQNAYPVTAVRDPGGVLTTYHYDDFGHLFALQRGGVWYYVAADQVGSPRIISDASGNVVKIIEYDAFGVPVSDSTPGFDLPIGFAGGISDPITDLVRFGVRDYDPIIGRWTAKDPILFWEGQLNLYNYAENNPIFFRDPSGNSPLLIGGVALGVYGAYKVYGWLCDLQQGAEKDFEELNAKIRNPNCSTQERLNLQIQGIKRYQQIGTVDLPRAAKKALPLTLPANPPGIATNPVSLTGKVVKGEIFKEEINSGD